MKVRSLIKIVYCVIGCFLLLTSSLNAQGKNYLMLKLPGQTAINTTQVTVGCVLQPGFTANWAKDRRVIAIGVIWGLATELDKQANSMPPMSGMPAMIPGNNLYIENLSVPDPASNVGADYHPGYSSEGTNKKYTQFIPSSGEVTFVIGDKGPVCADLSASNPGSFLSDELKPGTKYYVRMFAIYTMGNGWASLWLDDYSDAQSFTTPNNAQVINNVLYSTNPLYICNGNSPVEITGFVNSNWTSPTYVWESSTDNSSWSVIQNANAASYTPAKPNVTTPTRYWYRRKVTLVNSSISDPVSITYIPNNSNYNCPVQDGDGNYYIPVIIGTKLWLSENLRTTQYNDGRTAIANVTNQSNWSALTSAAYCYYDNDPSNQKSYGNLYSSFVATGNMNACPIGYHVAKQTDWDALAKSVNSSVSAVVDATTSTISNYSGVGNALKAVSNLWTSNTTGQPTNSSNFSAMPGGYRHSDGSFNGKSTLARFWSGDSTPFDFGLDYNNNVLKQYSAVPKSYGLSIRCVKD